jgi:hypothetical protein
MFNKKILADHCMERLLDQSDYLEFMHTMLERGKDKGYIFDDVDVFMTPPKKGGQDGI